MGSPWKLTPTETNFDVIPAGTYLAYCVALIDLGTHDRNYQDNWTKQRGLLVVFEFARRNKAGETVYVAKDYTASLNSKARLRSDLENWLCRRLTEDYDLNQLLGKACQLPIVHTKSADGQKTFANPGSPAAVSEDLLPRVGKPTVKPFSWRIGEGDCPAPAWLPKVPYTKGMTAADVIAQSDEVRGPVSPTPPSAPDGKDWGPPAQPPTPESRQAAFTAPGYDDSENPF